MLGKIQVDLNNIELVDDKEEIDKIEDFEFVLNGKPSFQVILNQSCYIAHMQGLTLEDINMINNSTGGIYESQQRIYQTLYNLINTTSVGKPAFKDWLSITSYFDLPTLYYGIYMQTFPGKTDFTITCGHCNQKIDVKVDNESFISVKDDSIYDNMNSIIENVRNPKEIIKHSLVNKFERTLLPETKIIVEVQTPSLNDHLNLLSSVRPEKLEEMGSLLMTLLFVKKIYFPDIKLLKETNKLKYFTVIKKNDIYRILKDLGVEDIKTLGNSIQNRIDTYNVEYKIKSFPCTNCNEPLGDIPIDMEDLLFREILQF